MSPTNLISLGQIEGQETVLGRLRRLARNHPPGRVFIFWGAGGAGKRLAARGLAAAWLCQAGPTPEPCGRCAGCLKLAAGVHPDLILLEPEEGKERVSIDQARELIKALRFAPVEGGTRVILLPDAEKLSLEAANALLKTLEEPPADTLTILTADDPNLLPPTVLSRGQLFFFPPRETAWVAAQLTKRLGLEPERARLMAALAGDNLETASGQDLEAALSLRADKIGRAACRERVS
jgi:DNA polymerase-3 subunit delta'